MKKIRENLPGKNYRGVATTPPPLRCIRVNYSVLKKMKKMSFKTMFEFDRFILSLDQTNISINILNSIISIDAPVFTVTYICIQGRHEFLQLQILFLHPLVHPHLRRARRASGAGGTVHCSGCSCPSFPIQEKSVARGILGQGRIDFFKPGHGNMPFLYEESTYPLLVAIASLVCRTWRIRPT